MIFQEILTPPEDSNPRNPDSKELSRYRQKTALLAYSFLIFPFSFVLFVLFLGSYPFSQSTEIGRIFKTIQKALRNAGKSGLSPYQSPGQDSPRLVLPAAIDGMKHSGFKIIVKPCCQVVGRRQLMVYGAGHAIN